MPASTTLVDILDRVLDKGLVVAGDIRVALANVELLTIQVRLLVCSIDKAQEIGLDWWKHDSFLTSQANRDSETIAALQDRIAMLERQLAAPDASAISAEPRTGRQRRPRAGGNNGG
jgi:hypothetical protein